MVNQPVNMEVESEDLVHTPNGKSCPLSTPISSNQCGAVDSQLDLEVSKEKELELDPPKKQGLQMSLSGTSAAADSISVDPDCECSTELSDESGDTLALVSFDSTNLIQDGEDIAMSPDKADKQEPTCSNNKSTHSDNENVYFLNKDAKITPSPVLQYLLDTDQPYDTIISCADGKIGAHRLVLASASSFIKSLFTSFNHRLGEVGVLILPDIRLHIMKIILNFCYTSKMIFSEEDQQEVLDVMKMLYLGENGDWTFTEVITREQREEKNSHSRSNSSKKPEKPGSSDTDTDSLFSPIGTPKPSKKSVFLTPQFPSPSLVSRTASHTKQKEGHKKSTSLNKNKEVPRIIQMFQNHKTSLKRKRTSGESDTDGNDSVTVNKDKKESEGEHDRKKRPRHDETPQLKSLKPQVARRTGIPVGRNYDIKDFDISKLRDGVPAFKGHRLRKNNQENNSVNIILGKLPEVYVGLDYDKTFISGVIALRNPPTDEEDSLVGENDEDEKQQGDLPQGGNNDLTINQNNEKEISKDCENVSCEEVNETENENLQEQNDGGGDNENVVNLIQNNDNLNHDEIVNPENNGLKGDDPCASNLLEAHPLEVVNTPKKSLLQVTQDESVSSPQKSTRIPGVNTPNKLLLQVAQDESVLSPRKSTRIPGINTNTPNKLVLHVAQDESVLISPRRSARISGVKPPTPPKVLKF